MRSVQVLLLAVMAVMVAASFVPVEAVRASSKAMDEEFEKYAVKVSQKPESAWGGAGRRGRVQRGRPVASACALTGTTLCGQTCTSLLSDANHCGACGATCASGSLCCAGQCKAVDYDNEHCGACGATCDDGTTCYLGVCGDVSRQRLLGY